MQFAGIMKEMQAMREDIDMGKSIDAYDLTKWLDMIMIDLEENEADNEQEMADLRDEARCAYGFQEQYLEQLEHAERHIEWLEHEFAEQIVPVDKYERSC